MENDAESAPGELETLRDFINTGEPPGALIPREEFDSPSSLACWLTERGLIAGDQELQPADVARAIVFREALRDVLTVGEDGASAAALERIEREARRIPFRLHFSAGGPQLAPDAAGLDAAFGRLLVILYRSMREGTWERMKACREASCRWAFFDRSKNRSRSWCDMSVCGNRTKARRRRARSS